MSQYNERAKNTKRLHPLMIIIKPHNYEQILMKELHSLRLFCHQLLTQFHQLLTKYNPLQTGISGFKFKTNSES